ncbi:hypothetical protein [Mesorhizobium sp. M7A.F.Ca.ET.027.02.1.1]|uniref:hypothetical protein n=1 Tax=Mesorhizobium sp. M7A.F.Ca.ET.027.02.1.1 TaxID=2496655 RepID=UPI0032AECF48
MMKKSAMGAVNPSKNIVSIRNIVAIVAAAAVISVVAGCQSMDANETNSVLVKPVVHAIRSQPAVQPVQAGFLVRSLRADLPIQMTSITGTESGYAFAPPQRIRASTPAPVKISFNPGDGGTFSGGSPYICSPSGFGQRASCRPRYL